MTEHTVSGDWRQARVAERLATATAIDELLAHVADVEAALADDRIGHAARSLAALLRSRRDELWHEARAIDAELVEP